jgi:hypothetical protein
LCGAVGVLLADHADDLGQFLHQVLPVLEPPRGVDQQKVGAVGLGLRHRVEGEARGVRPFGRGQHRHAGALAPDLQLFDRRRAEGVAGGDHHRLAGARNWLASLPMVVVLPEPLTPTTSTTCGFLG